MKEPGPKELAIRGCVTIYGMRRPRTKEGRHEGTGGAVAKEVATDPTTARYSRCMCTRPHGHEGEHRGPRVNIMRPTLEGWLKAKAARS